MVSVQGVVATAPVQAGPARTPPSTQAAGRVDSALGRPDQLQLQPRYRSRHEELLGIADMTDGALRNALITKSYHELSLAMERAVHGTTWVTLATWASKRAGQTIRERDVPGGKVTIGAATVAATALLGPLGLLGGLFVRKEMKQASAAIAGGNRIVFREIGLEFDRFLAAFAGDQAPDEAKLQAWLAGLRPGRPEAGGQQLLRDAFSHYYRAMFTGDARARQQLLLQGNYEVGLHEQSRLQPYIERAVPAPLRRFATRFMTLRIPGKDLRLSKDVIDRAGSTALPAYLQPMSPELAAGLSKYDTRLDSLAGSAARDWASLPDRMNYIGNFFEAYQEDQRARAQAPYKQQDIARIDLGLLPKSI